MTLSRESDSEQGARTRVMGTQRDYPRGEHGWRPSDRPSPMLARCADSLYAACQRAIQAGRLDARSEIADAALDYRQERDSMAERAEAMRDNADPQ